MSWNCIHHILQRASKLPFGRLSDWFTMPCSAVLRNHDDHDVSTTISGERRWFSSRRQDLKEVSPPTPVLCWKPYLLNLIHTFFIRFSYDFNTYNYHIIRIKPLCLCLKPLFTSNSRFYGWAPPIPEGGAPGGEREMPWQFKWSEDWKAFYHELHMNLT